jgi:GntP family gluconate:H+ symporter
MTLLALAETSNLWPFAVLAIAVTTIILLITKLRVHAFLALIAAAFLAGFLTKEFTPAQINKLPAALRADAQTNSWIAAVELTAVEFGGVAGAIAISIGLASIIGLALMESGAADKVVRRFLAVFGEKRAALALLFSTYILSIPIFFDTMFMLMVPLARALRLRTGKDYVLYVMCRAAGNGGQPPRGRRFLLALGTGCRPRAVRGGLFRGALDQPANGGAVARNARHDVGGTGRYLG